MTPGYWLAPGGASIRPRIYSTGPELDGLRFNRPQVTDAAELLVPEFKSPRITFSELENMRFYGFLAFIWKITAVESKTALEAKQWIQRIVVGTIGVEVAGSLVSILTNSVPASATH